MIIEEKDRITDKTHLAKTIAEKSSIKTAIPAVLDLIDNHLEHGVEIYRDGVLAGYMLIFNFFGIRSFHGYKLVEGYGVRALRLAKALIKKFDIRESATTLDQEKTRRALSILGFSIKKQSGEFLTFERGLA